MTAGGAGATNQQTVKSAAIKRLGGFELIAKVGQGGMGSVFKARQISLDRVVAVKVLPPSIAQNDPVFIERFIREARTSAKLNHPNVVQGIEVGQDETTKLYYFAMEFVDGPTVKLVLKQEKRIPEKRALEIVAGVTQALICAQKAGIVHRDIKPDNILLTTKGEVKLADLGLARGTFDANLDEKTEGKTAPSSGTNPAITNSGTAIGTPAYMAPEQIRGEIDKFDVRTDLYALGATLFHMVTGRPPYVGEKAGPIMTQHLNAPIPNPREFNPELSAPTSSLIVRLLQKDPAKRFQTANDLAAALNLAARGERIPGDKTTGKRTPVKPLPPVSELPPAPPKTSRGVYAAIIVLVVALAGVLLFNKRGGNSPTAQMNPGKAPIQPVPPNRVPDKPVAPPPPLATVEKSGPELEKMQVKAPVAGPDLDPNPKNGVPGVPRPLGEDTTTKVSMPATKDAPETQKAKPQGKAENDPPAAQKKDEPPLEEQVLKRIAEPLDKLDLAAARVKLKEFEKEKKLEPLQNTAAELALDGAIETHMKEASDQIEELIGGGKLDDAQKRIEAVKFSESDDPSTGEVAAKALINGLREKLSMTRTLTGLRGAMKQAADVDAVLLGVSAALDAGQIEQASKWIDEALKEPKLAPSADFFKKEKQLLTWYVDINRAIGRGATELADHRPFTLTLNDGRLLRIGRNTDLKYVSVSDGMLNLEQRIDRGTAKRPLKFDTLTRDTRFELSMLSNPDDKTDFALLKLKWAYADLSTMTAITSKSAGILDRAEKLIADAEAGNVPADELALVQPWLTRAQSRVRLPQKTGKGVKNPLLPYLPFINVVSAGASAGSRVKIALNGKALLEGSVERRGLNVLAINGEKLLLHDTYDTSTDPAASKRFSDAIAALPKGTLVIVAACDDACKKFQDTAYAALRTLGARVALQGKPYHFSYYCIGMAGLDDGLAMEEMGSGLLEFPKGSAKK